MENERMQAAIQELQDAMVHLEQRELEISKSRAEWRANADEYRQRIDRNLIEIADKLNRLLAQRPDGGLKQ